LITERFFFVFPVLDGAGAAGPEAEAEALGDIENSGGSARFDLSARGESGEKEGNDVRDLSEAAMDEAELQVWEESFRDLEARTVEER